MTEAYGWTPRQIGELTLYQLFCYLCGEDDFGGKVSLSPEQAMEKVAPKNMKRILYYSNTGVRETP